MTRTGTLASIPLVVAFLLCAAVTTTFAQTRSRLVTRPVGEPAPRAVRIDDDFSEHQHGWTTGYSDYSPANEMIDFESGLRELPQELNDDGTGLFIAGTNVSDDLFMFLKKRLDESNGIYPGQQYEIEYTITFASNVGEGCVGIGGSPGDSVYLKAGASSEEPRVILDETDNRYVMTIDKGNQSNSGRAASVAGTIANGTTNCQTDDPFVSVILNHLHPRLVWSDDDGTIWLVVGTDGFAQIVAGNGEPVGTPSSLLDGSTIHFASWSGEFWLIGGDEGRYQLIRTDATGSGNARQLAEAQVLRNARWSGRDWLMVGETAAGTGVVALTSSDPNVDPTGVEVASVGSLNTVDFNGIEWLAAGDGGLIHRFSAQGMPIEGPSDVLTGFDIHDVYFNGNEYLVAGEFGAIRRLGQDYLPIRAPIAVIDRFDIQAVEWTLPRGHASGPCLTNDLCYRGPCVGGLAAGSCCDRACDLPCESCFQDDTGEPDGTCAPVVAGKQPPVKPNGDPDPCPRASESTCGLTGLCDGAGACEFYGDEVQCADAVCSLGQYTASASCNGMGACEMVAR